MPTDEQPPVGDSSFRSGWFHEFTIVEIRREDEWTVFQLDENEGSRFEDDDLVLNPLQSFEIRGERVTLSAFSEPAINEENLLAEGAADYFLIALQRSDDDPEHKVAVSIDSGTIGGVFYDGVHLTLRAERWTCRQIEAR